MVDSGSNIASAAPVLALGAQDQVVSYSVFKVPAVSAYYFIYYAENGSVYFICS